jgi:DNA polymerase epsilon subunit 1
LLGNEIVKDKGLNVHFIVSKKPESAKVSERAIPTAIFNYEDENVKKKFLRKWCGEGSNMVDFDMKSIVDWDYYKERLAGTIMKIVTIPAALQKCLNPVPRIAYPDWLHRRLKAQDDKFKQKDMRQFFKVADIEDIAKQRVVPKPEGIHKATVKSDKQVPQKALVEEDLNIEDCPLPENNFKDWLKYQKSNWRRIRKDIKAEKKLNTKQGSLFNTGIGGQMSLALSTFMRNMDETVLNSNWHIISIEPTYDPGVLKVWALTESKEMFNVKLNVSRTVYINSKIVSEDADFKKV